MDLQKEAAILEQKPDDATEKGKKNTAETKASKSDIKKAKQRAKNRLK